MYEQYWGLTDKPFRNTPDPAYFYFTRQHEEALTRMLYTITEGQGAMLLTGDYGCGKSLLIRTLLEELDAKRYEAALIPYPNLTGEEFLQEILLQFGCKTEGLTKPQLLQRLSACLESNHERGCGTIVIVDEAQMVIDKMTLEEIRLLLNFQQDKKFYLTLLLLGQPELRDRVDEMPQLLQRLSIRFHLGSLSEQDGVGYLRHRLRVAGGKEELFTREAEILLVRAAEGVPRRINNLADMALLAGYGQKSAVIDQEIIRQVIDEMQA